jgi:CheY-like chemotaxis protein
MKTVLILEDDPTSRSVLKSILEMTYNVVLLSTPKDAIQACLEHEPDLLLADNMLRSATSGIETLLQVHAIRPQVPFLVVSGTPPEGWTDRDFDSFTALADAGPIDFLAKPFTAANLKQKVDQLTQGYWDSREVRNTLQQAMAHRNKGERGIGRDL